MGDIRIREWLASDTGDFVGTIRALLEAGATLPPHAEELEPSEAVLEVLP